AMPDVVCPQCRNAIPAADLNLTLVLAKCRVCNSVFQFADQVPGLPAAGRIGSDLSPAVSRSRPSWPIPLPPGLRQDQTSADPRFSFSWYNIGVWFLAFFCVFWDGFLVVWYAIAIGTGMWFMALFATLHLLVGVGLTYAVLTAFLNRTTIAIDRYQISVRHGPLPSWGNVTIPAGDVDQVYVGPAEVWQRRHGRHWRLGATNPGATGGPPIGGTRMYEVRAVLRDGSTKKLVSFNTLEEAHFIEQQIEDYLQIVDRPMPGEF
ncbi:MAG TPA: hypothetical protein VGE52_11630, partial [Pirellulales bacterium]